MSPHPVKWLGKSLFTQLELRVALLKGTNLEQVFQTYLGGCSAFFSLASRVASFFTKMSCFLQLEAGSNVCMTTFDSISL